MGDQKKVKSRFYFMLYIASNANIDFVFHVIITCIRRLQKGICFC